MEAKIEQRISHSTKIGKQVLITQFDKESENAINKANDYEQLVIDARIWCGGVLSDRVTEAGKALFLKTPVGKLVLAYAVIQNVDLLSIDVNDDQNSFWAGTSKLLMLDPRDTSHAYNLGNATDYLEDTIKSGTLDIQVGAQIGYCDTSATENQSFNHNELVTVPLTSYEIKRLQAMLDNYLAMRKAYAEYAEVQIKMRAIDTHMEKLEAELLMRELGSSDEGRKVLEMTESILKGAGSQLPVLENK